MHTNDTNNTNTQAGEIIYKDLPYAIVGVLIAAHNEIGPYAREKRYDDVAARIFKERGTLFERRIQIILLMGLLRKKF